MSHMFHLSNVPVQGLSHNPRANNLNSLVNLTHKVIKLFHAYEHEIYHAHKC